MKQSFLFHLDNDTTMDIPFEEIMFMAAIKANQLKEYCSEIYIIQLTITNAGINHTERLRVIVKVQAYNGEFSGYSYGNRWEEAMTKSFESILQQLRVKVYIPLQHNTN